MVTDRQHLLDAVRASLRTARLPSDGEAHPGRFEYAPRTDAEPDLLIEQFAAELTALGGLVRVVDDTPAALRVVVEMVCECAGTDRRGVLAWDEASFPIPGVQGALCEAGIDVVLPDVAVAQDGRRARYRELDPIRVSVTGALAGLADTGTLVLASGPGRGRLASLLPPVHIAILGASTIYPSLPAFLTAASPVVSSSSNVVLITGPSRTADIELTLTRGVHGPGDVRVIVVRNA